MPTLAPAAESTILDDQFCPPSSDLANLMLAFVSS